VADPDVNPLRVFSDWRTEYISDGRTLDGFFVAPDGDGPFPETRIYQPLGTERGNGHGVFNKAVDLWSPDVRRFLERWV
jgi:hypothetical protein